MVKLYDESKAKFAKDPPKAIQFATMPLGPLPKDVDVIDAAAWTVGFFSIARLIVHGIAALVVLRTLIIATVIMPLVDEKSYHLADATCALLPK